MALSSLDIAMFAWIHAGAGSRPVVDALAVFFGRGGPLIMAAPAAALWFLADESRKLALCEAAWAAAIGLCANLVIGAFYYHPRPYMVGLCTPLFPHGPETSFPSDHATLMFAAAISLLLARRWSALGILLLGMALLTAWGRVYSGVHFPLDMAGSAAVALMSVGAMRVVSNRMRPVNTRIIRMVNCMAARWTSRSKAGRSSLERPMG